MVSKGSVNHLLMIDVLSSYNISGQKAEDALNEAGLTTNKNMIPFDTQSPRVTSGIRLGTAAMTTRGFKQEQFKQVARWIDAVCKDPDNTEKKAQVLMEVKELCSHYGLVEGE